MVAQCLVGAFDQGVQIVGDQLGRGRCAHAHREGQAGVLGDAVVRHQRRQVKHVARPQHPVVGRVELAQQLQLHVVAEVGRRRRAAQRDAGVDLPAAMAVGLQQEHVVVVHVRADRAAARGEADHHVVHPPARQEAELLEQGADVRVPLVHVLHQQGPVVVGHAGELVLLERAAAHAPAVVGAIVLDQPRQRRLFAGQAGQVAGLDRRDEVGEGVADQQRALVPVIAQEGRGGHAQRLPGAGVEFEGESGGLAGSHVRWVLATRKVKGGRAAAPAGPGHCPPVWRVGPSRWPSCAPLCADGRPRGGPGGVS
ncbi:hypothetical protein NB706_003533 [Xanthomonas sacchari]|nr:hypothetical protein [Xanthomonas sacchari]